MAGWAAQYIGSEFAERGRGPAYDCWGLVWVVHNHDLNIPIPSYDDQYATIKDPSVPELFRSESLAWVFVETGTEKPGDVVLLRIAGHPRHVGIVTRPGRMLHILRGANACIENYLSPLWRNRVAGIYRHHKNA